MKKVDQEFEDFIKFNMDFMSLEKSLHILDLSRFIISFGREKFH